MTATESAPKTSIKRLPRYIVASIVVGTILGAATTLYFYQQYASVWLRRPPRLPTCVFIARRFLSKDDPVTGSIPHMMPDESMVYLRPAEDRAVRCMSRISGKTAPKLAAALAEVEPNNRARALVSLVREQIPADPSSDIDAIAAYMMASAAFRALPNTPEIDALQKDLDVTNACRFSMRTQCPSRPPIPMIVWIAGIPSSFGIIAILGSSVTALASRLRTWIQERRESKKAAKVEKPTAEKNPE